ncbi:hypothetical protein BBD42_15300 [Paenibacillus sp. BIHB 4019]|uniref:Uncharacterized protein n=1 Tax=Paenibacillus sp. BIHB 4019 TaxID=1870819 RepID=A0A1B2DIY8_9BACL|nr:hypothetical protein [Paenibacillus sp. BIHB 4019]ANY67678.1 hypothetical protein BBD42_15300 [Paenibacillus sp. BIHB 4019]
MADKMRKYPVVSERGNAYEATVERLNYGWVTCWEVTVYAYVRKRGLFGRMKTKRERIYQTRYSDIRIEFTYVVQFAIRDYEEDLEREYRLRKLREIVEFNK